MTWQMLQDSMHVRHLTASTFFIAMLPQTLWCAGVGTRGHRLASKQGIHQQIRPVILGRLLVN